MEVRTAAMETPIEVEVEKKRMDPAYPMAAAREELPSMEMNIMSTRSTAKRKARPILEVKDMTDTWRMRLPVTNLGVFFASTSLSPAGWPGGSGD